MKAGKQRRGGGCRGSRRLPTASAYPRSHSPVPLRTGGRSELFVTPQTLCCPTFGTGQGAGIPVHEFSVLDNGPWAPGAGARWQGTGLGVAAVLKRGVAPRRAWLARSQAPEGQSSRVPRGQRSPSALWTFSLRPTRRPGGPSRKTVWRRRAHRGSCSNEKSEN